MKYSTKRLRIWSGNPRVLLVILLLLISVIIFSQDVYIVSIHSPSNLEVVGQPVMPHVTIGNTGELSAHEVSVMISIGQGGVPLYDYQIVIPEIPSNEIFEVLPDTPPWIPSDVGIYTLIVELICDADPNTGNNTAVFDFEVQQSLNNGYHLFQVDFLGDFPMENSTTGIFRFDYEPVDYVYFVNVMAMNPATGQEDWIVRNLPAPPHEFNQTIDYWFDMEPLGVLPGMDIPELNIKVIIEYDFRPLPYIIDVWDLRPLDDFLVSKGKNNPTGSDIDDPEHVENPDPTPVPWEYVDLYFRGCTVPNIDLDSTHHIPAGGYAGDVNACGPAAAGNSMQWLRNTNPNIPSTSSTLRETVEELSGDMNRQAESGVTTDQLVEGKLKYIDRHKLPIHVKYQSRWNQDSSIVSPNATYGHKAENKGGIGMKKSPTFDFYKSEMKKGEDVEILVGYYDEAGIRQGGHWLVGTGYFDTNTDNGVFMKDDSNQEVTGGTEQVFHRWKEKDGWVILEGMVDNEGNQARVESIVSESHDPSVTHEVFGLGTARPTSTDDACDLPCSFTFSFPPEDEPRYINVRASQKDGTSEAWVLRNIMIPPFYTVNQFRTWWNLKWIGIQNGEYIDTIKYKIAVTPEMIYDSFFDVTYEVDLPVKITTRNVETGAHPRESPILWDPVIDTFPIFNDDTTLVFLYRGCEMPNIDLDYAGHPGSDTTSTSDWNACVPASTANSMHWLEENNDDIPSTNTSLRDKLEEFKQLMHHNDSTGTFYDDMVKGKLAYIDKYKLPIHVKFQGTTFDVAPGQDIPSPNSAYGHSAENKSEASAGNKPTWDFLVSELEAGEDVEMNYGFFHHKGDSTWRTGGHSVVVTGAISVGGVRRICFKHDWDQGKKDSTETVQDVFEWRPKPGGGAFFPEMTTTYVDSTGATVTIERRVEGLVSESYDPSITYPDDIGEIQNSNPFKLFIIENPSAIDKPVEIGYELESEEDVYIEIYDLIGRSLYKKRMGRRQAGKHRYTVRASTMRVRGSYLLVIRANGNQSTVKVIRK